MLSAPTNVAATGGDGQATVTWDVPASDGGNPIRYYTVSHSPITVGAITSTPVSLQATVTGLTDGTTYTFTVTATNAVGTSAASAPSAPVLVGQSDTTPPYGPSDLALEGGTPTTDTTPTFTWGRVNETGSGLSHFEIGIDTNTLTSIGNVATYTVPDTAPLADGIHTILVRPVDKAGNVGPVVHLDFGVDTTAPTAPTNLVLDGGSPTIYAFPTFSWDAATDSFGIDSYEVSMDGDLTFESIGIVTMYGLTDTPPLLEGSHTFSVRAVNKAGIIGEAASLTFEVVLTVGKIAFSSNRYVHDEYEIHVITPNGAEFARITINTYTNFDDRDPAWSPDASKIAFSSNRDGNPEIYVINADGSNMVRLTNNPFVDDMPAWSPDGNKVAFGSNRDGNTEIYVMNADGTGLTNLTNNPAYDVKPAWSPDGSKVAFRSDRDGISEIYVMNADGTNITRLTNNPTDDDTPAWSPDGSKIAFVSYRDGGNSEIYVMNADGTNDTRLTNDPASARAPVWSPNGDMIAFVSYRDGKDAELFIINSDGTGERRLTDNFSQEISPDWA